MKKIYLIEYQGRCDTDGTAVGHAPKVITEYYDFVKEYCDVSVLAPETIFNSVDSESFSQTYSLPRCIVMKGQTPFIEKITNKLHMFDNISKSIAYANKKGDGTLWFFNVEFYLLLYLALFKKPKHKIYLTMFIDGYFSSNNSSLKARMLNKIKQKIFEIAQNKIDLIISTGEKFTYKNCKNFYIPDYYYIPELYSNYLVDYSNKENVAVCLGTMGRGKQLSEMIDTFNRIGYPLKIVGRFYDEHLYNELCGKACDNISINNCYIDINDYLTLLSKSKYTILPYPEENYSHQTSGVMQEAIFVGTIPITYNSILDGNCVKGIGFNSWNDVTSELLSQDVSHIFNLYKSDITYKYSKEAIYNKYKLIFS